MAQDWTFEVIDIASNADQMLYTNAPCTNTQWGDQFTSWTVLFDDNAETFLHTEYAQNGKSEDGLDHYIRVDLGAGNEISAFKFDYTTRGGNAGYDFPQKFIIAGSNEVNGTYTEIGRIESGCPIGTARSYSSDVFTSETPYRYLRFMVTETNTDRKGEGVEHNYWHMGEFKLYKATPAARTGYVYNTGNINRGDRGLTSFTITDGENNLTVNSIQTSAQAPVYVDKSAHKLTTTQGATLKFTDFSYTGSWMHAYAYIDYNNDFKFNLTNNNNGEGEGEIVSYNFYDGNDITGTPGDTNGNSISNDYNGSKALPAFTLPTDLEPGEYRMRIKVDWNNLDADYGASSIAADGGCQCDITLVVEERAANSVAKAELKAAIEEWDDFLASISVGNCITQYSTSIVSPEAQIEGIRDFYDAINSETTIESIEEKTANVRTIKESYKENVLVDGKFYHIRSVAYENGYVYASVTDNTPGNDRNECNGICWEATTTPSNAAIWKCEIIDGVTYFKSVYTASYMSGLLQYCPGILSETEKAPITLTALGDGQVNFLVNGEKAHAQTGDNQLFFVPWEGGKDSPSAWYVEEATAGVQPHVLTVGAAGYATLMLGYNTTIPTIEGEGNGVFTAKVKGEYAVLNKINGVLPANTAVIIKAAPGEYRFTYTTETATVENNDLRGTLYDKYITEDAYVLGVVEGEVGLYTADKNVSTDTTNDGTEEAPAITYEAWKNNANKAYLPAVAGSANIASYSFRFGEGTTGIENIEVENEVKAIFDLTGRRVEAITAPGIYIVNGKKVLVK